MYNIHNYFHMEVPNGSRRTIALVNYAWHVIGEFHKHTRNFRRMYFLISTLAATMPLSHFDIFMLTVILNLLTAILHANRGPIAHAFLLKPVLLSKSLVQEMNITFIVSSTSLVNTLEHHSFACISTYKRL